ncbi:MAG: hypothetical protein ACYTA3_01335 [Planctomycetota bacterium]|jgi:hypothetical protein
MTKLFLTLAIGLALVGCETTSEPTDSPQPNFAVNSGVTQSVTGSGHYWWTHPAGWTAWRTSTFTAQMKADGSVKGRFQVNNHGQTWMKGVITCFTIVDNTAWLGGVVEKSDNPDVVGQNRGFRVADNREGNNAPPDKLSGLPNLAWRGYESPQAFCDDRPGSWPSMRDIEAGNIQVRP